MANLNFLFDIKAITLDWGDTLAHVVGKDQNLYDFRRLYPLLKDQFPSLDDNIIYEKSKKIIEELSSLYEKKYNNAANDWRDCNKSILIKPLIEKAFPSHSIAWENFFEKFCFQDARIIPHYKNLDDFFKLLKKQNYKIGLLSHVNYEEKYVRQNFKNNGLLEYFDFFSLSGDLTYTKPHPLHFQDALQKSGVLPHQILHFGDHPEKDGWGSKKAGFRTALIVEPGHYGQKAVEAVPADLFIGSIFEFLYVLEEYRKNPNSSFYSKYPC